MFCSGLCLQYLDVLVGVSVGSWISSLNVIILNVFNGMMSCSIFLNYLTVFK